MLIPLASSLRLGSNGIQIDALDAPVSSLVWAALLV